MSPVTATRLPNTSGVLVEMKPFRETALEEFVAHASSGHRLHASAVKRAMDWGLSELEGQTERVWSG